MRLVWILLSETESQSTFPVKYLCKVKLLLKSGNIQLFAELRTVMEIKERSYKPKTM